MELGNGWYTLATVKFGGEKSTSQNSITYGSPLLLTGLICAIQYREFEMQGDIFKWRGLFWNQTFIKTLVLWNKHFLCCYKVCLHKRVTFEIITPWKSPLSIVLLLRWWFPMLTYMIFPQPYFRSLIPGKWILKSM